jgi:hypothetical protein
MQPQEDFRFKWQIVFFCGLLVFVAFTMQNGSLLAKERDTPQQVSYNRSAAVAWASQNNYKDSSFRGSTQGRWCTTYVARALNAGGLNTSTAWTGNGRLVRWMLDNPAAWEERPLNELIEGDFVLYSQYSFAPDRWSYIDPTGGWSWWGHSALVISTGRVAAWNAEQYNLGIRDYTSLPYRKGVHILTSDPQSGTYQDQGSLAYMVTQTRDPGGVEHRWKLTANASTDTPVLFDLKPVSGNLTYRLVLKNAAGQVIVDTHSSSDGRGIIPLYSVSTGDYYLHVIPDVGTSGQYQITAYAHSIPRLDFTWGEQWSYSNVLRWQSNIGTTSQNFHIHWRRIFGNLEIAWELRTRAGTLLSSGNSVNGQVTASGSASGWVDFYITSKSGDGSYHIGIYQSPPTPADVTMPTGSIVYPQNGQVFGFQQGQTIHLVANATDNSGGSGVKQVSFWVRYGAPYLAEWRLVTQDYTYPYGADWTIPNDLRSQLIEFGIHVEDNAGNYCIDPAGNSCGVESSKRIVQYLETLNNPYVYAKWIPKDWRFYLNQRSLDTNQVEADKKCSGASAAMALAMIGRIADDYNTMKDQANAIYTAVKNDPRASNLANYLRVHYSNISVEYSSYYEEDGWSEIVAEINAKHPLILATPKMTNNGHYIVIIGYRIDGSKREIIAYDPFGRWQGIRGAQNYDKNFPAPESFKGQWVYYDYKSVWGQVSVWPWEWSKGYLITLRSNVATTQYDMDTIAQDGDPDIVSEELPLIETYEGVDVVFSSQVYLPLILR